MKRITFWILIAWLIYDTLPAQACNVAETTPALPNRLFYLERSKDANTVVYEANLLTNQKLAPQKPVEVYWMRYAEHGQRQEMTPMQWQMAYGYQHQASPTKAEAYEIRLNAFPKRPLQIVLNQGKPTAMMLINGQNAHLQRIFVQLSSSFHLVPKVQYVELYGVDADTGTPVYERISV